MDFNNLFSGTDNMFKFFFIGGLFMISLSMIYPLQKKQLIEIEIISHNKEVELLNNEIESLKLKVEEFKKIAKKNCFVFDSLMLIRKDSKNPAITNEIEALKKRDNETINNIKKQKENIDIKHIILTYDKRKIDLLNTHIKEYDKYSDLLFYPGIILGLIGFVGWFYSTINTEILKKQEIKKNKKA